MITPFALALFASGTDARLPVGLPSTPNHWHNGPNLVSRPLNDKALQPRCIARPETLLLHTEQQRGGLHNYSRNRPDPDTILIDASALSTCVEADHRAIESGSISPLVNEPHARRHLHLRARGLHRRDEVCGFSARRPRALSLQILPASR